jgi:hypothetical protein
VTRVKILLDTNVALKLFERKKTADTNRLRIAIYLYLLSSFRELLPIASNFMPETQTRISIVGSVRCITLRNAQFRPVPGIHPLEGLLHLVVPVAPRNNGPFAEADEVQRYALTNP